MQRIIEMDHIDPSDFPTVEALSQFSDSLFAEHFHNYFSLSRDSDDRVVHELQADIASGQARIDASTEGWQKKAAEDSLSMHQLFLRIAQKYGSITAHRIARMMEDRGYEAHQRKLFEDLRRERGLSDKSS